MFANKTVKTMNCKSKDNMSKKDIFGKANNAVAASMFVFSADVGFP